MSDKQLIHVRFASDGTVREISERPQTLTPQQWFDRLTEKAGTAYQALSGGRGLFRLPADEIKAIASAAVH